MSERGITADHTTIYRWIQQPIPGPIRAKLAQAIDYAQFEQSMRRLDEDFRLEDADALALENEREQLKDAMREKALTLRSFRAFIEHYIGGNQMMNGQIDVGGNGIANYTSTDAIAYINRIGLRIYKPLNRIGDQLNPEPAHSYIPENATEVAYIYNDIDNIHFQSLQEELDLPPAAAAPAQGQEAPAPQAAVKAKAKKSVQLNLAANQEQVFDNQLEPSKIIKATAKADAPTAGAPKVSAHKAATIVPKSILRNAEAVQREGRVYHFDRLEISKESIDVKEVVREQLQ